MKYETPPFREPTLYGIPVFSVGVDEHITYEGQYLSHRVKTVTERGKNKSYWIITTGFVTIFARHRDYELLVPVVVNGLPCPTIAEVLTNRDEYDFIEDARPIKEVEVPYDFILNLDEVTHKKSPALVIDPHGLLSHIPRDVVRKYYELMRVNKTLQSTIYEMSGKIHELTHQLEMYRMEHSVLLGLLEDISTKFRMTIASMRELKLRLLESKERQHYLEKALKSTTSTKEKWELLASEMLQMTSKFSTAVDELDTHLKKLEGMLEKVEEQKVRLSSFSEEEEGAEEGGEEENE